jgi:DNA-binding IclR family transcriptional regulator
MPGLQLTFAQACRLWQLDTSTCEVLLQQLVQEGFLFRTDKGAYIALSTRNCLKNAGQVCNVVCGVICTDL